MGRLLSISLWVLAASVSAIAGLICFALGKIAGSDILVRIGLTLFAPLVVLAILIAGFLIPVLSWANRKGNPPQSPSRKT
jgi:hypothetical protein